MKKLEGNWEKRKLGDKKWGNENWEIKNEMMKKNERMEKRKERNKRGRDGRR